MFIRREEGNKWDAIKRMYFTFPLASVYFQESGTGGKMYVHCVNNTAFFIVKLAFCIFSLQKIVNLEHTCHKWGFVS